ncbi:unnamed protein product [Wuchereria bancrofti]|uniref:Uncharacterized protein n=1 Tax=Wuchereria bancrofti TaxID=6293 RepID=A0A3P7E0S7_WUCBA|nr:unnamed protein product [Wuchereria bancrofti]
MIVGSLEHALSSTGGFCAGRTFVVYHQRLCGRLLNAIMQLQFP